MHCRPRNVSDVEYLCSGVCRQLSKRVPKLSDQCQHLVSIHRTDTSNSRLHLKPLSIRQRLKRAALRATYYSGAYRFISPRYSGLGTIFVIHKVVFKKADSLATWLTITVDFLDRVLAD